MTVFLTNLKPLQTNQFPPGTLAPGSHQPGTLHLAPSDFTPHLSASITADLAIFQPEGPTVSSMPDSSATVNSGKGKAKLINILRPDLPIRWPQLTYSRQHNAATAHGKDCWYCRSTQRNHHLTSTCFAADHGHEILREVRYQAPEIYHTNTRIQGIKSPYGKD